MRQRIFTLRQIIETGTARLEEAGVGEAALDAWYLLEYCTGISRAAYYGEPDRSLEEALAEQYMEYISMRGRRIPLQHITGEQEFMGYPFYVNEHVLIPRQDTETLAEEALKILRAKGSGTRVLDMCTGSGCILLSLMRLCPQIDGTGCDISEEALKVARRNAVRLGVNADWIQSDLFEELSSVRLCRESEDSADSADSAASAEGQAGYDVIVSNPPYICTAEIETLQDEVRLHDPRIALDGREDGLYFYRRIIEDSVSYIRDGGNLLFEIGCGQGKDVAKLMRQHGYENVTVKKDLSGLDRVVTGVYNREYDCKRSAGILR